MPSLPYMNFYPADYLIDTAGLSHEHKGMYVDLLCYAWKRGGYLPNDPAVLCRMLGVHGNRWPRIWAALCGYFVISVEGIASERMLFELGKAEEKSRKRSEAGAKGGAGKHHTKPKKTMG